MATKKAKKPELPQELYVYEEQYNNDPPYLVASRGIDDCSSYDGTRVGVYQLVRVVTVRTKTEVTVEE